MIKSNELRVGNLVKFGIIQKITMMVNTIHKDGINEEFSNDEDYPESEPFRQIWKYEELDPIPLTPEILGRCGFEDYDEYNMQLQLNMAHYSVLIIRKHDCMTVLSQTDSDSYSEPCTSSIDMNTIKYLHQLQNKYFWLCDEELPVNL